MKWMVTAFAAVGGVVFAKGLITTPKLSWQENTAQLLIAWLSGQVEVSRDRLVDHLTALFLATARQTA